MRAEKTLQMPTMYRAAMKSEHDIKYLFEWVE